MMMPTDDNDEIMEHQQQRKKRVAIIGAGVCGLTTAKCCLEANHNVVIYERSCYSGGLWRFKRNDPTAAVEHCDGVATVMHSTVINSSKENSAFSDYPPPVQFSNYMHNSCMMEYIESYANKFGVTPHIRFKHEVIQVKPTIDHQQTGRWIVLVKDLNTNLETTEQFDAVYIATGHHGFQSWPDPLPGQQDQFKGQVIHAHDIKSGKGFEGKRVVIVGLGNSGADLAAEIAPIAKQVYVSIRRGTWIVPRVGPWGIPLDIIYLRRVVAFLLWLLPYSLFCTIFEAVVNYRFDHSRYRLKPQSRILSQQLTFNDAMPNLIISGRVQIRPKLARFTANSVVFSDGTQVETDVVIFATGYKFKYPFLSQELIKVQRNRLPLYKFVFPPHLPHAHTLAFIGLTQPVGPIMPVAEMQARWAALLLTGNAVRPLPDRATMERDIEHDYRVMRQRFYESDRHTVQFDYMPYMDTIAAEIGARPPVCRYLFTDPILWWKLVFGCAGTYQWRLVGPHRWSGARKAIMELNYRVAAPFGTRKLGDELVVQQQQKQPEKNKQSYGRFALWILYIPIIVSTLFYVLSSFNIGIFR